MSNGDIDIREVSNPAVKITILFEEGNALIWNLAKPWNQVDLFMELEDPPTDPGGA